MNVYIKYEKYKKHNNLLSHVPKFNAWWYWIEKDKFYSYKSAFVEDVHTKKVSISNKISFGENN